MYIVNIESYETSEEASGVFLLCARTRKGGMQLKLPASGARAGEDEVRGV